MLTQSIKHKPQVAITPSVDLSQQHGSSLGHESVLVDIPSIADFGGASIANLR